MFELESQIRKWRRHLRTSGALGEEELQELESHLRDSIDDLAGRGVTPEEAFLVSVRRMGDIDALSAEFAKVSTESLWKQLLVPAADEPSRRRQRTELLLVLGLALLAGLLGKIPAVFGWSLEVEDDALVYLKNAFLFALPSVAIYLIWKRSLSPRFALASSAVFVGAALVVNLYPSNAPHDTAGLIAIHLPIALILFLGVLYSGPGWKTAGNRLDFVRFAGEVFIYSVLIGLGWVVLFLIAAQMFAFVDIDLSGFIVNWVAVFGGGSLLVVASYLVEQKKGRIETIAPVLARIFTPLFLLVLLSLLLAILVTGRAPSEDRELLIWFDLLLALVLGLTLYTMSAKDAEEPRNLWDVLTLALVVVSLLVDAVALYAIVSRVVEFGPTANRLAALGENILLLINLLVVAVGYARFIVGRSRYQAIVEMQMRYLPVYAIWAALVVVVFPPVFGFR